MPVGAPPGNQNAAKAKRWEAAIERALAAWPKPPDSTDCNDFMRGINEAAFKFVLGVMEKGDVAFFREFGDRLDGKVPQGLTGADGGDLRVLFTNADSSVL